MNNPQVNIFKNQYGSDSTALTAIQDFVNNKKSDIDKYNLAKNKKLNSANLLNSQNKVATANFKSDNSDRFGGMFGDSAAFAFTNKEKLKGKFDSMKAANPKMTDEDIWSKLTSDQKAATTSTVNTAALVVNTAAEVLPWGKDGETLADDVVANSTIKGATTGAQIGVKAGPVGAVIGAIGGGIYGAATGEQKRKEEVAEDLKVSTTEAVASQMGTNLNQSQNSVNDFNAGQNAASGFYGPSQGSGSGMYGVEQIDNFIKTNR